MQLRGIEWLMLVALVAIGCSDDDEGGSFDDAARDGGHAAGSDVAFPTEGWPTSTPAAEGMDGDMLETSREYAFQDDKHTQGVVVMRHGKIVAEWYSEGHDSESWATSWSMAKSFAATLIGIAVDEGLIPGVDVTLDEYFPEWKDDPRGEITLEQVLHMESGLDWVEDYAPGSNDSDVGKVFLSVKDVLAYVLAEPAAVEPGTRFSYSSGDTMLLSGILKQVTGMTAGEYARLKIFEPLGTQQADWWTDVAGNTLTWCCLDMPSREFAKLGMLYQYGGAWDGKHIVSKMWVEAALEGSERSERAYGYQIWTPGQTADNTLVPADTFQFNGFDGQWVWVMPSLDLIVVRNSRYIKKPGEPVADPYLLQTIPNQGLSDTLGSEAPETWEHAEFLGPILASIQD